MKFLRDLSLSWKLTLFGVITSMIALVSTVSIFAWDDIREARRQLLDHYVSLAQVFGQSCVPALEETDIKSGKHALSALWRDPAVRSAGLYDRSGNMLASFGKTPEIDQGTIISSEMQKFDWRNGFQVSTPIERGGETVGYLYLNASADEFSGLQRQRLHVALLVLCASLILAAMLASWMQYLISEPISQLVRASQSVSQSGDYSVRVQKQSSDELGQLCDQFNAMLAQIQHRDSALEEHRLHLEDVVSQRTRDLERKTNEALAASVSKSEFLANMSHEIRTPMNGIIGLTELLLQSQVSPEQRRHLELVESSGNALMTILNDILDFSKIEANKLQLDPIVFDPREAVGNAMKLLGLRAHERNLELTCRLSPDVPRQLVGDVGRIRQVLVNLVGNAVKFTHEGEVAVTVERVGETDDDVQLRFSVRDTGIGIPQDRQQQIFEPFTQVDGKTTRNYGGTGLGLTICTRLVELMQGRIWVESELGKGSMFCFQIPCGKTCPGELPVKTFDLPELDELPSLRALVVDDNSTNRIILEEMLHGWRMESASVDHGSRVQEVLEGANAQGKPFQIVLLDVQMPDLDGFDVARMMSQLPCGKELITIMLSSANSLHTRAQLDEIGVGAYLTKPVKQSEVLETILSLWEAKTQRTCRTARRPLSDSPANAAGLGHPCRILVAEDNYVNQQLMLRALGKDGHDVLLAGNGQEAVDILAREKVDVVLMDCQMPQLDGYQATQRIRAEDRRARGGQSLPIIALTANAMTGDREKCLAAGMDDFVTKPISFPELYRAINRHVVLVDEPASEASAPAAAPATAAMAAPAAPSAVASVASVPTADDLPPVIDEEELWTRIGRDHDFLLVMVSAFEEDVPQRVENLKAALSAGDHDAASKVAHTIKGTAGNLSGKRLSACAKELEQRLRGGNLDEARASLADLEGELQSLLAELRRMAQPAGAGLPA